MLMTHAVFKAFPGKIRQESLSTFLYVTQHYIAEAITEVYSSDAMLPFA